MWFVEALNFDDDYSGHYERYNTPFKIFYPIWAIFAGGLVVAIREGFGRFKVRDRDSVSLLREPSTWIFVAVAGVAFPALLSTRVPDNFLNVYLVIFWVTTIAVMVLLALGAMRRLPEETVAPARELTNAAMARWPVMAVVAFVLMIGMLYPLASTATRTREFHTHPWVGSGEARFANRQIHARRTLDALDHLQYYDNYLQDYKAITWLEANTRPGMRVLEQAGENAYSHAGRISTGAGLISILSWKHHQHQWRGRAKAAPDALKARYIDEVANLPDMTPHFRRVVPGIDVDVPTEVQRDLRLASPGERLAILRVLFPTATLDELHLLRRQVELRDVNMNQVMSLMLNHVHQMYTSTDREKVRELMTRYEIDLVVVGRLERDAHGQDIDDRLAEWGFTKIFDSADEEHQNPFDPAPINYPTRVYQVPGDFRNFQPGGSND